MPVAVLRDDAERGASDTVAAAVTVAHAEPPVGESEADADTDGRTDAEATPDPVGGAGEGEGEFVRDGRGEEDALVDAVSLRGAEPEAVVESEREGDADADA